jgi:hypothetical protein
MQQGERIPRSPPEADGVSERTKIKWNRFLAFRIRRRRTAAIRSERYDLSSSTSLVDRSLVGAKWRSRLSGAAGSFKRKKRSRMKLHPMSCLTAASSFMSLFKIENLVLRASPQSRRAGVRVQWLCRCGCEPFWSTGATQLRI